MIAWSENTRPDSELLWMWRKRLKLSTFSDITLTFSESTFSNQLKPSQNPMSLCTCTGGSSSGEKLFKMWRGQNQFGTFSEFAVTFSVLFQTKKKTKKRLAKKIKKRETKPCQKKRTGRLTKPCQKNKEKDQKIYQKRGHKKLQEKKAKKYDQKNRQKTLKWT